MSTNSPIGTIEEINITNGSTADCENSFEESEKDHEDPCTENILKVSDKVDADDSIEDTEDKKTETEDEEEDAYEEAEETDEEREKDLKRNSIYYQYYSSYTSPDGRKYKKDDSTVPDELLIKYIDHMGYTKFTSDDFEFKYYSGYAKIKEYNIGKYRDTRKYTMHDDKEIEEKLLEMINRNGCICYRPSLFIPLII